MSVYGDLQLTNEELVALYQSGDVSILEQLITNNMGMIHKIAKKFTMYNHPKYDVDDLVQEGSIGIILAAERFKFDHSVLFITYASYWIFQCIAKMATHNKVDDMLSLDKTISDEDTMSLGDTISDEYDQYNVLIEEMYQESVASDVRMSIEVTLNDLEKTVIKSIYGIGLDSGLTLQKTGELVGLERESIRIIQARSLRKLRNSVFIKRHRSEITRIKKMIERELSIKDIDRGTWSAKKYNFMED